MSLYALTIFCGAFLLFFIQPLMGKYLLPWFGGGPGVWTTCLLFFQTLLLGGYAYAHFLQRLAPKRQALIHLLLVIAALAFLPVAPGAEWKPAATEAPIGHILLLLTVTLGLPYLVLAATGPLLQRWFTFAHPGIAPYRLYALSNGGSLLALVAFPFFFEPRYSRGALALGWSVGLGVFAVLCGVCAWRLHKIGGSGSRPTVAGREPGPPPGSPTPIDRLLWFALPAVASVLLVATTNKLCLDIAAVPFLWVLPLGVYLVTFILCFDHPRWYARGLFAALLALSCLLVAYFFSITGPALDQMVIVLGTTLFVACMVCHGELHRLRPAPSQLTGYYLAIAAGGASGSLFVSLVAPLLFSDYRELQLGLVLLLYFTAVLCWFQRSRTLALGLAAGLVAVPVVLPLLRADSSDVWYGWFVSAAGEIGSFAAKFWMALAAGAVALFFAVRQSWRGSSGWHPRLIVIPGLLTLLLAVVFVQQAREDNRGTYEASRNFYGVYKVLFYDPTPDPTTHFLVLANGGVTHGQQFLRGPQANWATTYYSPTSGLGRAFSALPHGPRRIGAVGLGAGTLAVYGRHGDFFRFYEINPAIIATASSAFTYLKHSPATVSLALGDARLVMEGEVRSGPAQRFDLLVLDAFSGDAIPIHLLTREALQLYLQELRPGGIIAVHISNRHLDLRPVIEGLAMDAGLHFATIHDAVAKADWWLYDTDWVLLSADAAILQHEVILSAAQEPPDADAPMIVWTDDHASLLSVVK